MVCVLFLLSFGFVAAGSCDDSQTIMRLYSPANSHVSAWDQEVVSYVEEICYDEIFGSAYGGANPHGCTGDNMVLSLSSDSNAHASETSGYGYDVCYGDLECVYDSSAGAGCSNAGETVARISSSTNAHVAYASDSDYGIKVCCTPGIYWADMNGNPISSADFGDRVQMIKAGGVSGTFNIWEEDTFPNPDDDIRSVTGEVVGGNLVGVWEITNEDLDKADDFGFEDIEDYEIYFTIDGVDSDSLGINSEGNDSEMAVDIVSPSCGDYFDVNTTVSINIVASDPDDEIMGEVRFNDKVVNFSNGGVTINEVFNTPGNFQIIAEGVNSKEKKFRAISNIMILDKSGSVYANRDYVAACITEPEDYSNIPGTNVWFNASSTRGIEVVSGVVNILYPGIDAFDWSWTFEGSGKTYLPHDVVGMDKIGYIFNKTFSVAGQNSASLSVEV